MCKRKRRVKIDKQVLRVKDKDDILKWEILGEESERIIESLNSVGQGLGLAMQIWGSTAC